MEATNRRRVETDDEVVTGLPGKPVTGICYPLFWRALDSFRTKRTQLNGKTFDFLHATLDCRQCCYYKNVCICKPWRRQISGGMHDYTALVRTQPSPYSCCSDGAWYSRQDGADVELFLSCLGKTCNQSSVILFHLKERKLCLCFVEAYTMAS